MNKTITGHETKVVFVYLLFCSWFNHPRCVVFYHRFLLFFTVFWLCKLVVLSFFYNYYNLITIIIIQYNYHKRRDFTQRLQYEKGVFAYFTFFFCKNSLPADISFMLNFDIRLSKEGEPRLSHSLRSIYSSSSFSRDMP